MKDLEAGKLLHTNCKAGKQGEIWIGISELWLYTWAWEVRRWKEWRTAFPRRRSKSQDPACANPAAFHVHEDQGETSKRTNRRVSGQWDPSAQWSTSGGTPQFSPDPVEKWGESDPWPWARPVSSRLADARPAHRWPRRRPNCPWKGSSVLEKGGSRIYLWMPTRRPRTDVLW